MHKRALSQSAIVLGILISSVALSPAFHRHDESLRDLASSTVGMQGSARATAVTKLRRHGPAALEVLIEMRDKLARSANSQPHAEDLRPDPRVAQLNELIDHVAGQRYACTSRLYWYTDFEEAKAVAAKQGKPILSLRMLGLLTDEYSCANSRFFRTTLYANTEIANKLRKDFVLHWRSVRPVPRVTIDFGDGRKLERTLTGNSIHYLLNADGEPLDALPGLYSPNQFLSWLEKGARLSATLQHLSSTERANRLLQFHSDEELSIGESLAIDLAAVGENQRATDAVQRDMHAPRFRQAVQNRPSARAVEAVPPASAAAALARPKSAVEFPIIRRMNSSPAPLAPTINDEVWEKIAQLPQHLVVLDRASFLVIKREVPSARAAGRLAISKRKVEDPLARMLQNLRTSIAVDTVRNEYMLHRQIHQWFIAGETLAGVDPLNERVYAELFLTPSSDPWLGLAPADTYTALYNGGVTESAPASR